MAASNDITIDRILLAQTPSVLGLKIPQEIIEAIVGELEESSLPAFCLATTHFIRVTQARIFRSIQIRVDSSYSARAALDYRSMSPRQAERLFMSSPHLAQYVKRLWIDIPSAYREDGPGRFIFFSMPPPPKPKPSLMDYYPPLQTVLPVFTAVRQLEITGHVRPRWIELPQKFKEAIQPIMSLPCIEEIQFSGFDIPASVIRFAVESVPALALFDVVVEGTAELVSSSAENLALRKLTLMDDSKTGVDLLRFAGVPSTGHLSNMFDTHMFDRQPGSVHKILQASATTLTSLRLCTTGMRSAVQVPCLPALRILELDMSENIAPLRLPDLFVSLLTQIPGTMPCLGQVALQVTVPSVPSYIRANGHLWLTEGHLPEPAWTWAHSGPLDVSSLPAVHCALRFYEYLLPIRVVSDSQAKERELLRKEGVCRVCALHGRAAACVVRQSKAFVFTDIHTRE
ncbi:hypothetical protein MSAN_00651700 [Mycena sanguinolenta]|uniref:Uncharacterized protein n=1 Tax=Mycena sanguinolenta TaxID=230812 RepID=A0A8H7DCA4_9AGAR|nr:hypothetical protein MSAN_00651700 [Mycena sanguinolenta]